ncbi:MAG: YceD family protein [Phormidesmis sp.]
MRAIHIPQILNAPNKTIALDVDTHLPHLATLTPVKGEISIAHQGTYLEVKGKAHAIMTLECDRCLQSYNTRIQVDTTELVWLEDKTPEAALEKEVDLEDLVESLSPQGNFDPNEWLYEQMCLAIPQKQICRPDCKGIEITSNPPAAADIDHRWAALSSLKQQLLE